ncbi:MAG: hypothetical protein H8D92_00690 [Pelagibacteraceae bacterium]|jgi:hypothetical protein|nr:hypothetical protein [Pelagibacteraceae bacterium]
MKTSFKTMVLVVGLTLITPITSILASELTQEFKNPAFSGNGYSSHVLSINQLEVQREQKVIDDKKSAAAAAERDEKNKTVNKFIANVESRIYANLSKQLVDNMFGTSCDPTTTTCPTSGTSTIEGAQIYWVKDSVTEIITLTITADDGTVTTMAVPIGDFKF